MVRLSPPLVWLVLSACGAQTLSATLKDMLRFEDKMDKPYNMSEKLFNTKEFQGTRKYDGLKEFKTAPIDNHTSFPLPGANKTFDRAANVPVGGGQVFTGKSFLGTDKTYPTESAGGFSGNFPTKKATGISETPNPLGDKSFSGGDKRYEGPELERRTTEVDIINKTLRNKETLKGETLSMEEVREILNRLE